MKTAQLDNTSDHQNIYDGQKYASLAKRTGLGESQSLDQAFVIVISTGPVTLHNFHIKIHTEEIHINVSIVTRIFRILLRYLPGRDYINLGSFVRISLLIQ